MMAASKWIVSRRNIRIRRWCVLILDRSGEWMTAAVIAERLKADGRDFKSVQSVANNCRTTPGIEHRGKYPREFRLTSRAAFDEWANGG